MLPAIILITCYYTTIAAIQQYLGNSLCLLYEMQLTISILSYFIILLSDRLVEGLLFYWYNPNLFNIAVFIVALTHINLRLVHLVFCSPPIFFSMQVYNLLLPIIYLMYIIVLMHLNCHLVRITITCPQLFSLHHPFCKQSLISLTPAPRVSSSLFTTSAVLLVQHLSPSHVTFHLIQPTQTILQSIFLSALSTLHPPVHTCELPSLPPPSTLQPLTTTLKAH